MVKKRGGVTCRSNWLFNNFSLLVRSEILGKFHNTLTTDDKYYRPNKENFQQPFQLQLSNKPKSFCQGFIATLTSKKNDEPRRLA